MFIIFTSESEKVEGQRKPEIVIPPEKQVNEENEVEMVGQIGAFQRTSREGVDRFAPFSRKMSSENLKEDGKSFNQRKEELKIAERKKSSDRDSVKKARPEKTQNKGKTETERAESQEKKKGRNLSRFTFHNFRFRNNRVYLPRSY